MMQPVTIPTADIRKVSQVQQKPISKGRSLLYRVFKKVARRRGVNKVVSRMAFDSPTCSYRFLSPAQMTQMGYTDKGITTNIDLLKYPGIGNILQERHYSAHGSLLEGDIPVVVVVPNGMTISSCSKVIVYSHGTSADLGLSLNTGFRLLSKMNSNDHIGLVLWDYPGYGLSNSAPSESGMCAGILTVYRHLVTTCGVDGDRIVALGQSLGSVPTSYLASRWSDHELSAVIYVSPIASAYYVISHDDPTRQSQSDFQDPLGALSCLDLLSERGCPWPVVVFHGDQDTHVPIEHGRAMVDVLCRRPSGELKTTAEQVARCQLQDRIAADGSDYLLWKSVDSSFAHDDDLVDDFLYQERSVLLPIPGAGHNDVMQSHLIYEGLREVLKAPTRAHEPAKVATEVVAAIPSV